MKITFLAPPAAATALLTAAVFVISTVAQTPQMPPAPAGGEHHMRPMPAPTNLQVLPKDLTGEQVHQIMDKWASSLGTHCNTCHAAGTEVGPNGRPRLDFALDTKPEKATARLMYKMTQDINGNYISKIDNAGVDVSCATCHRGHLSPPPFTPPPEQHEGMPPAGAPPAGAPPTPGQ